MNKKIAWVLGLFLLADLTYTFLQYVHGNLDGDLCPIILPAKHYAQVLADPLGISVWTEGREYAGTNRFFAHWSLATWFRSVPFVLQALGAAPVDSLFLSAGLAKMGIQLGIIWVLASCITGSVKVWRKDFLLIAFLLSPLFVTQGYLNYFLGVVLSDITYTFFYPLAVLLVLLFFLPFLLAYRQGQPLRLRLWQHPVLLLLAVALPLHGPLNFAVLLLVCPALLLGYWRASFAELPPGPLLSRAWRAVGGIPGPALVYLPLAVVLSLYSYYLGHFNVEGTSNEIYSLAARYGFLLKGLAHYFWGNEGFPLLVAVILFNAFLLYRNRQSQGSQLLPVLGWLGLFSLAYLALLPLGGYRSYRHEIIRFDTFLPVTICMFFAFGATTFYILKEQLARRVYLLVPAILLGLFLVTDKYSIVSYRCARKGLLELAASPEPVVHLNYDCEILSWGPMWDLEHSTINTRMLEFWGVLQSPKKYSTGYRNPGTGLPE